MHPSRASRLTVSPVAKFLKVEFGFGPPVPAAGLFALDECGHPNCYLRQEATTIHKSQSQTPKPLGGLASVCFSSRRSRLQFINQSNTRRVNVPA
jgi:hypothetical protein